MTPYIDEDVLVQLRGDYTLGIFFRLGTDPALHLTFSLGDVPIVVPDLDDPGTVYTGAGRISQVPALEALVNGLSDNVSFELNGLDVTSGDLIYDTAPDVLGAIVTVGIAPMDLRWQPLTDIIPLWTGSGEFVRMDSPVETDRTKPRTMSIQLQTSSGDTSRALPHLSTYTNASQQSLYPTDTFFSRMPRYVQGLNVAWPRY